MHDVVFRLKRAHLQNLIFCRPIAARFELTPARFDMLFALFNYHDLPRRQFDLRGMLGLAASTISKMLRRLEQLGLVHRESDPRDHRHRLVSLTREGRRRIDDASDDIVLGGEAHVEIAETFDFAIRRPPLPIPEIDDLLACQSAGWNEPSIDRLFDLARRFAHGLGDRATLIFSLLDH